jgi:hypothetical protein
VPDTVTTLNSISGSGNAWTRKQGRPPIHGIGNDGKIGGCPYLISSISASISGRSSFAYSLLER